MGRRRGERLHWGGPVTEAEASAGWLRTLLNWRKTSSAVHHGRLLHYAPDRGLDGERKVMVVINKSREPVALEMSRFHEALRGDERALEVTSGKAVALGKELVVPARSTIVLQIGP